MPISFPIHFQLAQEDPDLRDYVVNFKNKYAEANNQISLIELAGSPVRGSRELDPGTEGDNVATTMGDFGGEIQGEAEDGYDDDDNGDGAPELGNDSGGVSGNGKRKAVDEGEGDDGRVKEGTGAEQGGESRRANEKRQKKRKQRGGLRTLPTPQRQPQEQAAMEAARCVKSSWFHATPRCRAMPQT